MPTNYDEILGASGQPIWYIGGGERDDAGNYVRQPGVLKSLMERSQTTFNKPYAPYKGRRVAPLKYPQHSARNIVNSVAHAAEPKRQHGQTMESLLQNLNASSRTPAQQMLQSATGQVRQDATSPYMSSIQDKVLNRLEDRMLRNLREKVLPSIDNERIASGRFLQPGRFSDHNRALRDLQEVLAGQEAEVLHKGVYEAEMMGKAQKERELEGARITGGLESADLNRQLEAAHQAQLALSEDQRRTLEGANQMNMMGEADRNLEQEALNIKASDFAQEQGHPAAQLEREAAIARGFNPRSPYEQPAMPQVQPSLATQLAGAGLMAMAMNRPQPQVQNTGFAKGGHVKVQDMAKHGRYGDTEMAYIPQSVSDRLDRMIGGPSYNPTTGKKEYFLGALLSAIPTLYELFKPKPEPRKPEPEDISYGWGDGQSARHSRDMNTMKGFGFQTLGEYDQANNMARDAGFNSYADFNKQNAQPIDRDAEYQAWRQQKDMQPHQFPNSTPEQAEMLRAQGYAHGGRVRHADGGNVEVLKRLLMDPNASMAEQAVRQNMGQEMLAQQAPTIDQQMMPYEQQLNQNPLDKGAQAAMSALNKRKADKQMQQSMAQLNTMPHDPWASFLGKMGAGLMKSKNPDVMQTLGESADAGFDAFNESNKVNSEHQRRTAELHKAMQETYRVEELERAKAEAMAAQNQTTNTETKRHNQEMEAIGWANSQKEKPGKSKLDPEIKAEFEARGVSPSEVFTLSDKEASAINTELPKLLEHKQRILDAREYLQNAGPMGKGLDGGWGTFLTILDPKASMSSREKFDAKMKEVVNKDEFADTKGTSNREKHRDFMASKAGIDKLKQSNMDLLDSREKEMNNRIAISQFKYAARNKLPATVFIQAVLDWNNSGNKGPIATHVPDEWKSVLYKNNPAAAPAEAQPAQAMAQPQAPAQVQPQAAAPQPTGADAASRLAQIRAEKAKIQAEMAAKGGA
jgi:hypothetical protein